LKYSAHLLVIALLLPGAVTGESKIYKSRDANGNVVFTDVPPINDGRVDEPVVLKETNTWEGPGTDKKAGRAPWIVEENGDEASVAFVPYATLTIVDPDNDAAVRANNGQITVTVSLLPPLSGEHQLRLLMDGKPVGQTSGRSFQSKILIEGRIACSSRSSTLRVKACSNRLSRHSICSATIFLRRRSGGRSRRPQISAIWTACVSHLSALFWCSSEQSAPGSVLA